MRAACFVARWVVASFYLKKSIVDTKMIEIVEEGARAFEQAKDGPIHAAKIEFAPGLTPEDVDLKRTEDCRFSPSGKMIAVAGFVTNSIMLFTILSAPFETC